MSKLEGSGVAANAPTEASTTCSINELAALNAQEQHTDKATALRQWLHEGAAHYVLNLVAVGRISAGRAAELLDATRFDVYRMAESHGIELGATDEQRRQSRQLAEEVAGDQAADRPAG